MARISDDSRRAAAKAPGKPPSAAPESMTNQARKRHRPTSTANCSPALLQVVDLASASDSSYL